MAIIGAGALGSLFSRNLSRVVPTALIGRGTTDIPEADWVIVLVKAYDTAAALRTASRMKAKGIVSLQNGLIDAVPQGVTTAAAYREGKRVVPVATGRTAVFRVRIAEVLDMPYRRFVEALAREAAPVLAAEGVGISPTEAIRRVMHVAYVTAGNRSSMLQDIMAGRRTEIEQLTGALLRLARRHRLSVPTHRAFYQLIRVMEAR